MTAGSGNGTGMGGLTSTGGSGGPGPIIIPNGGAGGGAGTGGGGSTITPDAACATGMAKADLTPVNMFIQFDRSGSMNDDNKWPQAAQALTGFFQDAGTAGLRVALRFFPHDLPAAGCTGGRNGACDVMACAQPLVPLAEVQAAPMDTQETALVAAVMSSAPPPPGMGGGAQSGGTPISAALDGALTWARANLAATPNERTVVVLVTDGEPNGCQEDIEDIAALASTAYMQGIPTYAIGIAGASEDQMNEIAQAGGTMQAFFAGDTMTAQQDLIDALNAIRGRVLSCDFPLPTGMNVDPTKVNINFTPSTGGMPETIGQAADAAACGTDSGWFYDNNAAPTRITLCQSTCDRVTADPAAQLDVLLGCATVAVPPR